MRKRDYEVKMRENDEESDEVEEVKGSVDGNSCTDSINCPVVFLGDL